VTVVVLILLGLLVVGFGYSADRWHRRAEFWERLYLAEKANLDRLLDGIEKYAGVDEGVVRVLKKNRENPAVYH
jgi:hypothetical protein